MGISIPYRSVQRVYFDDLDALNILHNVRFLLFMERARGELFNELGFHWQDDIAHNPDKFHVVAAHEVRYLAPVRGEGEIAIEVRPVHLGSTSLVIAAQVASLDDKTIYAEGRSRMVRLDPSTFRPAPWSDKFRSTFEPLVRP